MYASKNCLNGQLRIGMEKKNLCENICNIDKKKKSIWMWCLIRLECCGADTSGNLPPPAAGRHHAVCTLHLGIFKRIDAYCAYQTILIFPFIFFFFLQWLSAFNCNVYRLCSSAIKNNKIRRRPLHCAVQPISAAPQAHCARISSPMKQSAVKHLHKEWKCNHWRGEQNIWVYIINQSARVELEVWGENRQSAADGASSLFVSCARQTGSAGCSLQRWSH